MRVEIPHCCQCRAAAGIFPEWEAPGPAVGAAPQCPSFKMPVPITLQYILAAAALAVLGIVVALAYLALATRVGADRD